MLNARVAFLFFKTERKKIVVLCVQSHHFKFPQNGHYLRGWVNFKVGAIVKMLKCSHMANVCMEQKEPKTLNSASNIALDFISRMF